MGKNTTNTEAVKLSKCFYFHESSTFNSNNNNFNGFTDVEKYFMDLLENDKNLSAGIGVYHCYFLICFFFFVANSLNLFHLQPP